MFVCPALLVATAVNVYVPIARFPAQEITPVDVLIEIPAGAPLIEYVVEPPPLLTVGMAELPETPEEMVICDGE